MNLRIFIGISISIFFLLSYDVSGQDKGKLEEFENEISDDDKDEESSNKNNDSESNDNDYEYDCSDTTWISLFVEIMKAGAKVVFDISDPKYDENISNRFNNYPYGKYGPGHFSSLSSKKISFYTSGSYFYENSTLTGFSLQSRFSPSSFLNIDFRYTRLRELINDKTDHLEIFNLHIGHNRIKRQFFDFWYGVGFKQVSREKVNEGFALSAGTNIYFKLPVSLSAKIDLSFINNTNVYDNSLVINYHLNRFKVFMGYQYYGAGSVTIQGITTGLGFYL